MPEPRINPPLQRRSQEALERLLDAGLQVLQEVGFEGFTLQEVSRRAGVSIGSIYARVSGRESLIMAIYERAMAWTEAEPADLAVIAGRAGEPRARIESLVTAIANNMLNHGDMLRVFMRQGTGYPEIWERAAQKSQEAGQAFMDAVLNDRAAIRHADPEIAIDVAYRMVYCTVARRITHGPRFESGRTVSDARLVREMARATADYLL